MDYLKELAGRADLVATWEAWSPAYRILAIAVGLALAYWALRVVIPAVLGILRPVLLVAFALVAVWALFPDKICAIEALAKLPVLCAR